MPYPGGFPLVSLEVQGMRASIKKAFLDHVEELSSEIQQAVDLACTPENVKRVVAVEVARAVDEAVREEVERFYKEGPGRRAVRDAVSEKLRNPE